MTTDVIFLGKINESYISFVIYLLPWLLFAYAIIEGLSIPITVLVGRSVGANDPIITQQVRDTGFWLFVFSSIILIVAGTLILPKITTTTSLDSELLQQAFNTYRIYFALTLIPWCVRSYEVSFVAGLGHTSPSYIGSLSFILTKLLIQFIGWKIYGVSVELIGISTLAAMCVSAVMVGMAIRNYSISFFPRFNMCTPIVYKMLIIGTPVVIANIIWMLESSLTVSCFDLYGTTILGALGLIDRYRSIMLFPMIAISAGLSIFVSQNLGANNIGRAKIAIHWAFKWMFLVYLAISAIGILGSSHILYLLAPHADAIRMLAQQIVPYEILSYPILALGFVAQGGFEGFGKTYPNLTTLIVVVLFGRLLPYVTIIPIFGPTAIKYILPWSHSLHAIEAVWIFLSLRKIQAQSSEPHDPSLRLAVGTEG